MWVRCVLVDSRVNTLRANPLLFPLLLANQALMHRARSSGWPYEISDLRSSVLPSPSCRIIGRELDDYGVCLWH